MQALGGAVALVGCLELLVARVRRASRHRDLDHRRRDRHGNGPVAGGLLTAGVLVAGDLLRPGADRRAGGAGGARRAFRASPGPTRRSGPAPSGGAPNLTLAFLSAALTAALFLLVLLLVDGWQHSPAIAAITVSVVPLAALVARPLARLLQPTAEVEIGVGCFLIAGGLVGLALLPSANLAWTVAPQALIGLGLGLTLDQLTSKAMHLRSRGSSTRAGRSAPGTSVSSSGSRS